MSDDEAGEYWADPEQSLEDDGLPSSARDQSCAICGDETVRWLHPLAKDLVEFRAHNSGYKLPKFWALCDNCESLLAAGADDKLLDMQQPDGNAGGWDELSQQSLATFRRADLGARAFGGDGHQVT